MSNNNADDRLITVREALMLLEPVQSALSALTVSVIKMSSALSSFAEHDFVKTKGQEAFDNIDVVIREMENFADVANSISGRDTDND